MAKSPIPKVAPKVRSSGAFPSPLSQAGKRLKFERIENESGALLSKPKLTAAEVLHHNAQSNAALPVEQGGLGLRIDNTAEERLAAQNYYDYLHGTQRLDRVLEGKGLDPNRATSGPMPFGTDATALASKYATSKSDTSRQDAGNMADYFQVSPKELGMRGKNPITVEQSWHYLSPEQKNQILSGYYRTGYANPDDASGAFTLHPEGVNASIASKQHLDHVLKESRGNPLTAIRNLWGESGELYDNPEALSTIYKVAGYPYNISQTNAPWTTAEGVLLGKARIENPLITSDADNLINNVIPNLKEQFKGDRSRLKTGADMWAKESRYTPNQWVEELEKDVLSGKNSFVWTSIPDKVTGALKQLGHDGIIDVGGKAGGEGHQVVIPFDPSQVRSRFAAFDPLEKSSTDLLKADGGMVETPAQEAIADTVQNPNAARMLEMDLANLSLMQQPRRMAEGGNVASPEERQRLYYEKRQNLPDGVVADTGQADGVEGAPTVASETSRVFGMDPNADRLSILPRYSREEGLVAPQFLYDAARAVTAPSVAARGYEVAPEEAANLALNVAGGGFGASSAMRNPTGKGGKDLGMFVGQKSNTWDMDKYEMALKMDKAGIDPSEINRYTGYFKNPSSNVWSQEISDASAMRTKNLPAKVGDFVPLKNVMRHENLFYAYPDLKNVKVTREAGAGASYYSDTNTIAIGKDIKRPEAQLSALIHEVQHAIQKKENFPRGTNPKEMQEFITPEMEKLNQRLGELFYAEKRDPKNEKEWNELNTQMRKLKKAQKVQSPETYMRAEGEAQARATEERRRFSEAQRRAIVPSASFDRPMSQLHQVYANGGSVKMSPEEMLIEMMESKYGRR